MKRWTEVSPYTGIAEDAPANNASSGDISMPPDAVKKKKKVLIDRSMMDARTKAYREHRTRLEARRVAREAARGKSKFIENIKKMVSSEMTYGSGYDVVNPTADIQPVYAEKSNPGYEHVKTQLTALYHKDFSDAMQHAYTFAKSKGVTVDPAEIDDKVASGPRKPSSGNTNSYILGTDKKNKKVHIQVAFDNNRYELNMYID
jgi:FtsZ-interacting cell division protein YlmF